MYAHTTMTKIKIHNVYHDKQEFDIDIDVLENKMEQTVITSNIKNVRIAKGNMNSPIYVTYESGEKLSLETIKRDLYSILNIFSKYVSDVDVDETLRDRNIHVQIE